jgi:hypothetical protein
VLYSKHDFIIGTTPVQISIDLDKESVGVVIRDTLFSMIRVHINIVHDYGSSAHGSLLVGQQPGIGRASDTSPTRVQ